MPNRAESLRWETADDPPLRTALIDAALAIADEEGLEAVSVRRVGEQVGRRPMSLYSHVPSKDALVALMFERVNAQLLVPETGAGGQSRLWEIATRSYKTYLAHPWVLHALSLRPPPGPSQMLRAEQSAAAVREMGYGEDKVWPAVSMIHEWIMGHALHTITLRADHALSASLDELDPHDHPIASTALANRPARDMAAFEDGFDTLLAGIEARARP